MAVSTSLTAANGCVNANGGWRPWYRPMMTRRRFALVALLACWVIWRTSPACAACADPPPPVRDIIADRFYLDTASSVADKVTIARNKSALATLDRTLNAIIAMEDKALAGDAASAACVGRWLVVWAQGGALLGHMSSQQAVIERQLRTAGMAVGYLKIRAALTPADRATIEAWLNGLGDQVVADRGWPARRNNLVYWAGFAAGAVGTATGADRLIVYSRRAYDAGMTDIQPDGTLPMELQRRTQALDYTNYALAPLIMAAELAKLRGEDWYTHDNGAIHRLAARVLAGLRNPKSFAVLAHGARLTCRRAGCLAGWRFTGCGSRTKSMARHPGHSTIHGWAVI